MMYQGLRPKPSVRGLSGLKVTLDAAPTARRVTKSLLRMRFSPPLSASLRRPKPLMKPAYMVEMM